ncbi:hypothetical protein POM88_047619 [Heracleum sosnowskyi]|uniref:Receptor-like protein 12 n=1 Tax=Heracleum sosnowskyi TaxID=360622 RepID=A0AAD8LZS8_9APIA|nr:hypothetical protein POM88_047619 [Heracleum sosnowskyi]
MAGLSFLSALNLSENHLAGSIPRGGQFDTFDYSTFLGNLDLCGLPLTKRCNNDELPTQKVDDDNDWLTDWKIILIGYGIGLACGLSTGYIILTTGKPWLFVKFIERVQQSLIRSYLLNT